MSGFNYPQPHRGDQDSDPYAMRAGERGSASSISSSTFGRQRASAYQQQQSSMYTPQPSTEFQPMRATYPASTTGIGGGMISSDRPVPLARTVMVDILEGRNLPNVELIGKVDPYCLLLAGSDKIKTRVHKDAGTNLTFNDTAEVAVAQGVDDMLLEVWDFNHVRGDRLMGRGRVSVADTKMAGRVKDTWVELRDDRGRMAGEVHVKIAPRYVLSKPDNLHGPSSVPFPLARSRGGRAGAVIHG
ncbi:hypothetical protein GGF32_006614 [Allomyces javanicus]|nr:hypothetical protein GGF32_006614 [Allomyces javanicus]